MRKGIPAGQAIVFSAEGNFHGRTTGVVSMSTDPESRDYHGPYLPNVGAVVPSTGKTIRYNHYEDLEEALERHGKNVAAFIVEPIQGEAGYRSCFDFANHSIVVPDDDYLPKVRELCTKHNVLLIADEIQTGIARTGKMLCVEHWNVKPDVVLLGKAISGGVYPVSAVLANKDIMLCFEPGTHGSTYGGNPLACAVAIAALKVVKEENLVQRAAELGDYFVSSLKALKSPLLPIVRGKGLFVAIVIDESKTNGRTAWQLCLLLKKRGLLAKPTHENIIRLAPPLVISKGDLERGVNIIKTCLEEFLTADIPEEKAEQGYHPTMDE
jgi:ornithine--oxo-acid transaminase